MPVFQEPWLWAVMAAGAVAVGLRIASRRRSPPDAARAPAIPPLVARISDVTPAIDPARAARARAELARRTETARELVESGMAVESVAARLDVVPGRLEAALAWWAEYPPTTEGHR